MSIKLDTKDKKILYELDLNSRQSLNQIGKKVGLPKNVVAYRINRLEEQGVIQNYHTVVDASKLGYNSLRFYLKFQYTDEKKEAEIKEYFIKSKLTWWIGRGEPLYDLGMVFWLKDYNAFHEFWKQTLEKYGLYFKEQTIYPYMKLQHYNYSFLTNKKHQMKLVTGGNKQVNYDDKDFEILKMLAANARINITEIAKKTSLTVNTVKQRMKRMTDKGIIVGYRTNFDLNKLGLIFVKININLKEYKQASKIISYIEQDPKLIYIDFTIGYADLEIEYLIEDLEEIKKIMEDIRQKFPGEVTDYSYFIYKELYKVQLMPEE
ncbi:Lrp/AsnC family transcriptional regulator [Candidatus Woesearchaeota archaeon]|nr:Lrp/AsnC family transcriptional regulator [Candidatus Woesearchaeota archaeon]